MLFIFFQFFESLAFYFVFMFDCGRHFYFLLVGRKSQKTTDFVLHRFFIFYLRFLTFKLSNNYCFFRLILFFRYMRAFIFSFFFFNSHLHFFYLDGFNSYLIQFVLPLFLVYFILF